MISRAYKVTGGSPEQSTSTAPVLAGLVSALRPVKRVSTQLAEESLLLRRFSYKNKNQHKGCGWWRKVIEVDRVMERLGTELEGLLGEFGFEKQDKDEVGRITEHSLVQGLLRLPRAMLIAEKSLSVLLGSASILEQLLHSRAFMAFALVVVSLIARLHSLTTVLSLELSKLSLVLTRLLFPTYQASLLQLPRSLRHLLAPSPAPPSLRPTLAIPTSPAPPSQANDELGSIVSRPVPPPTSSIRATTREESGVSAERITPLEQVTGLSNAGIDLGIELDGTREVAEGLKEGVRAGSGLGEEARGEAREGKKRVRVRGVVVPKGEGEGKKKKKKKKGGGDEIDDIFG